MRLIAMLGGRWLVTLVSALLLAVQGAPAAERWCGGEWRPVVGSWAVEGEHYAQANERLYGAWTLWQDGRYDDCDVQVEFRVEPVGAGVRAAGILFRGVDDGHFFYAHFDSRNNQVMVIRWSEGSPPRNLARFSRAGVTAGEWLTARVLCQGSRATLFLDGRRLGEVEGISPTGGLVGLRAGQGKVAYRNWKVEGTPHVGRPEGAPPAWWNRDWHRRIPIAVREPGRDDRDALLVRAPVDFAGHARVFPGATGKGGARTDVVVIGPEGRPVPSAVLPERPEAKGALGKTEVRFLARVEWMGRARYDVYFDNPRNAGRTQEMLAMGQISFASLPEGAMPPGWQFPAGAWTRRALSPPEPCRTRRVVVQSERHVAFPGICKTKSGALLVVYREGYSHASGNADDGRVMLTRSTDGGKTWAEPVPAYDDPEFDDRNAAISCMGDGTVVLIWDKYLQGKHHWAWMATSKDEGRTWSPAMKVSKTEDVHTRSPALDLGGGKWLVPYSESTHGPTTATFFSILDPATRAFEEVTVTPLGQRNVADEVCVTRAPNGDLVALIRSNTDPALFQVVSRDDGKTWSPARMTEIPSQFTPADLITLNNGWLLCSFSFRERRNERLVVSRDNGASWDVENSVDLFVATPGIGDRSYPASVQLDAETIGTVLYETHPAPKGGAIYFVTTPIAALSAPKQPVLHQGAVDADPAVALWPETIRGNTVEVSYRFTGLFGPPPNAAGLLLDYRDAANYTALEFQMGASTDRRSIPTNHVQLVRCVDGKREVSNGKAAAGAHFDTGNVHRLGARRDGDEWVMLLDGNDQIRVPASLGKPCGFLARRAAVALYEVGWLEASAQMVEDAVGVKVGPAETR